MITLGYMENNMEHYTVYGKDDCAFCDNSKAMLSARDKSFTYKKLNIDYDREDLIDTFSSKFDITPRTFPQIILTTEIGETYIGGFTELREFLNK